MLELIKSDCSSVNRLLEPLLLGISCRALRMPCFMLSSTLHTMCFSSVFAFPCVVFLTAFPTLRMSFAVCCLVSIITAVVALLDLELWCEVFSCMDYIIDTISICYSFVGFMVFIEEYNYQMM